MKISRTIFGITVINYDVFFTSMRAALPNRDFNRKIMYTFKTRVNLETEPGIKMEAAFKVRTQLKMDAKLNEVFKVEEDVESVLFG